MQIDEILVCPKCKFKLERVQEGYRCVQENRIYKVTKGIPDFILDMDENKKYQESIWAGKTYKVDPKDFVFTTIQERFGNRIISKIKLPQNAVVVDIGSFIGEKLWQVSQKSKYLGIGVDIAIPSLVAGKEIDTFGHQFVAADMEFLPFADNSVDLILVFDVIEHLTNQEDGFKEVARVLKPGGKFLLHIPIKNNKFSFFWWKRKIFPNLAQKEYDDVGHSDGRMLTTQQIKKYIELYDLDVKDEIYYNSFFVHFFDREFSKLIAFLASLVNSKQDSSSSESVKTVGGSIGLIRKLYGKILVPVFEVLSFPDYFLSKLNIGNTYFVMAKKHNLVDHVNYYKNNYKYTERLNKSDIGFYQKYLKHILNLVPKKVLDVGCGAGQVVNFLSKNGVDAYGVEVSESSVKSNKRLEGKFSVFDGVTLPFDDNYFDVVGNFTVLEHVEKPQALLAEMVRVLKPGGKIIIACPNFYRVIGVGAHHWRNRGLSRLIKNFFGLVLKKLNLYKGNAVKFEFIKPIVKEPFEADDDAICLTNAIDIGETLKVLGIKQIYLSGSLFKQGVITDFIMTLPILRSIFGNVFFVGEKE